jgi:hypothetical protein
MLLFMLLFISLPRPAPLSTVTSVEGGCAVCDAAVGVGGCATSGSGEKVVLRRENEGAEPGVIAVRVGRGVFWKHAHLPSLAAASLLSLLP